jgi:hypothetical protein
MPAARGDEATGRWDGVAMPETTPPTRIPTPSPTAPRRGAGRVTALVVGSLIGLLALGLFAAGGALLWADGQKDAHGDLSTGPHRFASSSYAIASDDLDVDLDGAGRVLDPDRYGDVRLTATSRNGKDVFVGIAPTRDVEAYLARSAHATVTDVSTSPFRATYRAQDGTRRPTAPTSERFWAASSHGAGTQSVRWDVRDGRWSVVVMNADGTRGVDAGVGAGASLPFLTAAGWGSIGGGALLALVAAGLVAAGTRPPRPGAGASPAAPLAPAHAGI